jgi:multisubunit Na+/H+ antiporter MnhF subunit
MSDALLLKHMWASPNLPWSIIALAVYFIFPYELSPSSPSAVTSPLSLSFFCSRFPLWFALVFGYNAFFHVCLYFFRFAQRPMLSDRVYNWDKVAHNVFWSVCGIAIWVGFENVFVFLWTSGRLAYMSDAEAFSTTAGMIRFVLGLVVMARSHLVRTLFQFSNFSMCVVFHVTFSISTASNLKSFLSICTFLFFFSLSQSSLSGVICISISPIVCSTTSPCLHWLTRCTIATRTSNHSLVWQCTRYDDDDDDDEEEDDDDDDDKKCYFVDAFFIKYLFFVFDRNMLCLMAVFV